LDDRCSSLLRAAEQVARFEDARGSLWRLPSGFAEQRGAAGRLRLMPDAAGRPEPFTPQTAPAALEDLRARLRATRWPDTPEDAGWSLGTDLVYLRELVAYWADEFDWLAREAALAQFPRFRVALGGLGIHFVHVRATAPAGPVLPLILSHGWPDSFWRYAKVIALLTDPGAHGADPADSFDVIVPDMPGYGYSEPPSLRSASCSSLTAIIAGNEVTDRVITRIQHRDALS
jgi:hypothetical protein